MRKKRGHFLCIFDFLTKNISLVWKIITNFASMKLNQIYTIIIFTI